MQAHKTNHSILTIKCIKEITSISEYKNIYTTGVLAAEIGVNCELCNLCNWHRVLSTHETFVDGVCRKVVRETTTNMLLHALLRSWEWRASVQVSMHNTFVTWFLPPYNGLPPPQNTPWENMVLGEGVNHSLRTKWSYVTWFHITSLVQTWVCGSENHWTPHRHGPLKYWQPRNLFSHPILGVPFGKHFTIHEYDHSKTFLHTLYCIIIRSFKGTCNQCWKCVKISPIPTYHSS